jgi:hypothetical protein
MRWRLAAVDGQDFAAAQQQPIGSVSVPQSGPGHERDLAAFTAQLKPFLGINAEHVQHGAVVADNGR